MIWIILSSLLLSPADKGLDGAIKQKDTDRVIQRINSLVSEIGVSSLADISDALSEVESIPEDQWYAIDRYRIFVAAIRASANISDPKLPKEVEKIVRKHKSWPARVFALELSLQTNSIDSIQLALVGIKDKSPQVVSVSARILGRSMEVLTLEPLVAAMARWESSATRDKVTRGGRDELKKRAGDRAWLACRDALQRLTGMSLHTSSSYKNWINAHREEIDPTKVDLSKPTKKTTGTGLFGLEITGNNIVFLLDVSGSMMATDPPSEEQMNRLRRSTGTTESFEKRIQDLMDSRRRIKRARSEITKAVDSLGDDKNFSVISFSSEVKPWSDILIPATRENKKSAITFVARIKAQGITVTDIALHDALSDPSVDTIYLITDGAPTHIGSQGNQIPPDAPMLMKQISEDTKARNHLRGVRIFTLGFIGAEEDFLKELANDNHGRYVRIR